MVSIVAFQAVDPGSIPGQRIASIFFSDFCRGAQIAELILLRSCVRRTVLSTVKVSISFGALLPDSPQSGRCPTQES